MKDRSTTLTGRTFASDLHRIPGRSRTGIQETESQQRMGYVQEQGKPSLQAKSAAMHVCLESPAAWLHHVAPPRVWAISLRQSTRLALPSEIHRISDEQDRMSRGLSGQEGARTASHKPSCPARNRHAALFVPSQPGLEPSHAPSSPTHSSSRAGPRCSWQGPLASLPAPSASGSQAR